MTPEIATLVNRGLTVHAAETICAIAECDARGLFVKRQPGINPEWAVGRWPRDSSTEGEGDSLVEALADHKSLEARHG